MSNSSRRKLIRRLLVEAFEVQGGKCHLCGKVMNLSRKHGNANRATADHIIPKCEGGKNVGNIAAAHCLCNQHRGHMSVEEYLNKNMPY